jgi:hypothetical protein
LTDEDKRAKIMEIIKREEGIAMATETLSKITQDQIEYARMTTLIKSKLDYQSGMVNARRSGRKEAREEILNYFEQGLSVDEIKERLRDS